MPPNDHPPALSVTAYGPLDYRLNKRTYQFFPWPDSTGKGRRLGQLLIGKNRFATEIYIDGMPVITNAIYQAVIDDQKDLP